MVYVTSFDVTLKSAALDSVKWSEDAINSTSRRVKINECFSPAL